MRLWMFVVVGCSGSGSPAIDAAPATIDVSEMLPSGACDGKPTQPADATWTITVGGLTRTAKVHLPAGYARDRRTPLVLNIHGRTHDAAGQLALSHAIAKSDAAGFVVIHPEAWGTPTSWNAGGCCDPATSSAVDDIGFVTKLLDEAEAKLCIDPDRIYVMGLSNGGYLAHRVACQLADRIAAIAPVAASLVFASCAPARPVPVWMANGTADPLVSYAYAGPTTDYWVANNGCTTSSTTFTNGDTSCVTHAGCTSGAEVVLCTVAEGGHQWPGGDALPFLGKKTDAIIATDAIWEFFVAHPRT